MDSNILQGKTVVSGYGEGYVLISKEPFMFAHGVDPSSGDIVDKRSCLLGENIKNKVLIFPFNKGSTTGSAWILETIRCGNAPAAIVTVNSDMIIATGFILGNLLYENNIPVVEFTTSIFETVSSGDYVKVIGSKGIVEII